MNVPVMSVPVVPDRGQAREWAIQELSKREYQEARPSLISRAFTWINEHLTGFGVNTGPAPKLGLAIVVILLLLVAAWAVRRSGGLHRNAHGGAGPVLDSAPMSSAEHHAAADRYAASGDWDNAVIERFRAIARELEERTVLAPQQGRTANEIASAAAAVVPSLGGQLAAAAASFDDVRYGGRAANQRQDDALRELSAALRSVRTARMAQAR